ncbi:MAG: hypothetical protein JWQ09_4433 [Segetibacter sp.]|nr:hypothetical protein [Segetibacter sp.]
MAQSLKAKFNTGWNGTITVITSEKSKYQNRFIHSYQSYATEVKSKTEQNFKKLGSAIDSLAKNEVKVYEALNKIQTDWTSTKKAIADLEGRMKAAFNSPETLGSLTAQHAQLVAKNFIRLEIIDKYVNKGMEVYNTVARIKSDVFDRVTDPTFIKSLSLDKLSLPTLSSACASAAGFASQVAKTFPNCRPLQTVAAAANYLMAAVNIGVGVAELYSLNPMGLVNIFSGLSSIFGGKPEPSPEMKMMQQMMDYMSRNFEHIDERLDSIEKKIDRLTQLTVDMYKDMMKSFLVVNDKLDQILWQTNTLYDATRLLVFRPLTNCMNAEENRTRRSIDQFRTYDDLLKFYQGNPGIARCLPTIREFSSKLLETVSSFSLSQPSESFRLGPNDLKQAYYIDTGIYRHMVSLFFNFYGNDCNAINSLGIPSAKISNNGRNYTGVKNVGKCMEATIENTFSIYFNYAAINQITNLLITYSSYYLLQDAELAGFNPLTPLAFLKLAGNSDRYNTLVSNLTELLDRTNKSISQQSLMAGNNVLEATYNYLLGVYDVNEPNSAFIIDNAVSALQNNVLFAKNFTSKLINESINDPTPNNDARAKRFTDLYYTQSAERKDSLNEEFKIPGAKYELDNTNTLILRITPRGGREVTVPIPSPTFIINDEMAQSDGLYSLLSVKQKIVDKLIDITFFQNFEPVEGLGKDDYKYLIQELKN